MEIHLFRSGGEDVVLGGHSGKRNKRGSDELGNETRRDGEGEILTRKYLIRGYTIVGRADVCTKEIRGREKKKKTDASAAFGRGLQRGELRGRGERLDNRIGRVSVRRNST